MEHKTPPGYDEKFVGFLRSCERAKAEGVAHILIAKP